MTSQNQKVTIRDVYNLIEKLEEKIEKNYVHKTEFMPVKSIAYGIVGVIMMAAGTAIMGSIIKVSAMVLGIL